MFVLKAIGRFFAKIGRWIRDTAWVQPLLIVGGIFAIIFSIPKIVEWVDDMNEESNAAQTFFENKIISSQGKEGSLSEGSTLDKFMTILENKEQKGSSDVYSEMNSTLALNGQKRFFVVFVDSSSSCDALYTGMKYLNNNWDNPEFAHLEGDFTYRTIYVDAVDKYDESTKLFENAYDRHNFESFAADLYETKFAENMRYDEGASDHYDSIGTSASGFSVGTVLYFNYEATAYEGVHTAGLRSCFTSSDIAGSTDYERAQNLGKAWGESQYSVFGNDYEK